ncbi:DUF4097 and DUF4098 domain-containing protein YvlB [Paenibacillus endophyticus]|uniref:DUF4097 and DUF4098 domain-containing protein YvlB n=1 Tax=Paenibacillus endophyticus TaxID=1294268 RepID=A0A7W5C618_9BACL|nr:DUF4097 family beta strand repeat-containing protein [Paenibacillus endophyticus]MBB3150769.1 DUF4097 and DUF4098 domain-containing protein YvlB [Paenibacillus endophyticus]
MKKLAAVAIIMLGIGIICAFFVFNENDLIKFKGDTYTDEITVDASDIRSIHTETDTFDITFVHSDSQDVKMKLEGNVSKKLKDKIIFKADKKGDALYIVGDTKNGFNFGISIVNLKMTIELPDKIWDTFDVESDTGKIDIDQIQGNKLLLSADTGNLNISNYSFKQIEFDTDTGNATFTDGEGPIKGETDTGNIRLEAAQLQSDVSFNTDTGNITVNVDKQPESALIKIRKDTGRSQIDWSGFEIDKESGNTVERSIGSGDVKISIESDTGNIKLGNR